jgi:hypothetical protein
MVSKIEGFLFETKADPRPSADELSGLKRVEVDAGILARLRAYSLSIFF